jgi:hypothetical protein
VLNEFRSRWQDHFKRIGRMRRKGRLRLKRSTKILKGYRKQKCDSIFLL